MAVFNRESDLGRLDYHLVMRAPVRLLHSRTLLAATVTWLRDNGYHVVTVDASWLITAHMFRDLGAAFGYVCHDRWTALARVSTMRWPTRGIGRSGSRSR